jgi:hypothetical protein
VQKAKGITRGEAEETGWGANFTRKHSIKMIVSQVLVLIDNHSNDG